MNRRRMERLLWVLAVAVILLGVQRWRRAEPVAVEPAGALATSPPEPRRIPRERLAAAGRTVEGGNPFRLDRVPAPIGFNQPSMPGMGGGGGT